MVSSVTWLDHDGAAHERALELLACFTERESLDELGIGGIRDAIADRLFPGTSTIQTRLRYMFFISWSYADLEEQQRPARVFPTKLREMEVELRNKLLETEKMGVIGRTAGATLKRMPSAIYWSGLGVWGLRRFQGSQQEYHASVDQIYSRRASRRRRDDAEWTGKDNLDTWHPQLLALRPNDFPAGASFTLTQDEADLIIECIQQHKPDSLLAWLALHTITSKEKTNCEAPWQHPNFASFPQKHQNILRQARIFSFLHHGATLLYNLLLAELHEQRDSTSQLTQSPPEVLAETYRNALEVWAEDPEFEDIVTWSPESFWPEVSGYGHTIRMGTRQFVEQWRDIVLRERTTVADAPQARALIRHRECQLKGHQSRLTNVRALEQWNGNAGTGRLVFRWPTAQRFLNDLREAFTE